MNKKIRVNAFDMNCVGHIQHGMWTHPRDRSTEYNTIQYWHDLARLAERGKFDGIFLADSVGVCDLYRGGPAPSIAGPTGVWRGVRDGMGCALCIALGRRLCRSTVVAFDASPRTATLAPGSVSENNERCSNKISVTPTRERMPWTSGCRTSMRS